MAGTRRAVRQNIILWLNAARGPVSGQGPQNLGPGGCHESGAAWAAGINQVVSSEFLGKVTLAENGMSSLCDTWRWKGRCPWTSAISPPSAQRQEGKC